MSEKINKVFVYGTLLQGEIRSPHMSDCKLLKVLGVSGTLYDTKRGYPAASFDEDSEQTIYGELYVMDNLEQKLKELDQIEGVESGLFNRVVLNHKGLNFYTYDAGSSLNSNPNKLEEGSWRRHSSVSFHDPITFAQNFENRQRYLYREPGNADADGLIYIKGDIPLIVTAPHSSVHRRLGKLKRQEFYSAALSVMLHSLTGCHVLYTNRLMESDPNFYDESPFKKRLGEIVEANGVNCLVDLHGTGSEKKHDIYPGVGINNEFLLGQDIFLDELEAAALQNNIFIGGLDIFPAAKQMTVTKYAARKLEIPSIQVEINRRLREPEKTPEDFIRLIKFLRDFVEKLSYLAS